MVRQRIKVAHRGGYGTSYVKIPARGVTDLVGFPASERTTISKLVSYT
jgi:hypothetical protein